MFNKYREILSIPGALQFSIAGLLARFPMALVGISTILMIKFLYGNYALAGTVSAAGVIAFAIGSPLLSRLVDARGQAKIMVPALLTCGAAIAGLTAVALTHGPAWALIGLSALAGASSGAMGALVRARWAFVATKPGQIQAAYSLEAAFDELAFVIGPVVATLLSTTVHPAAGLWLAVFFVVFGGLWFLSQKSTEPPVSVHEVSIGGRSVMLNPAMLVLALTFVGAGAMFGSTDLSVVAFTEARGMPALAGPLLAVFAFGSLMGALVYGARSWKWPLWKLFAAGIAALTLGVSTFIFASTPLMLGLIMVVTGVSIAPTMTNVSTIVQKIMPPSRLTEGLAWMSTAINIGVSIGAAVTGPILDNHGARAGFLVVIASAWFMLLAAMFGLSTLRRETVGLPGPMDTGIMAVKPTSNEPEVDQCPSAH